MDRRSLGTQLLDVIAWIESDESREARRAGLLDLIEVGERVAIAHWAEAYRRARRSGE